jgi:hypothetical protein
MAEFLDLTEYGSSLRCNEQTQDEAGKRGMVVDAGGP